MSLREVEKIVRPATVEEAWETRRREPEASRFLAGGMDLILYSPPSVKTLIDLSSLRLDEIREDRGDVVIGATATLSQVIESPLVAEIAGGFLVEVLRHVASPLQRNLATIGGAAVRAHPWSDVVPALLVLDGQLDAYDGRDMTLQMGRDNARAAAIFPLVRAVRIPAAWRKSRAAFEKFARTAFDVAVLNCACAMRVERGRCREARVAIGGTPTLARRLHGLEGSLVGQALTSAEISAAARLAAAEIDARDDRRATAAYRRRLADVAVRRCLEAIATKKGTAR